MTKYREILRLSNMGLSRTSIGASLGYSRNTVADVVNRAQLKGVEWPLTLDVTDGDLQALLYPEKGHSSSRKLPDCEKLHKEMAKSGVTLTLLWDEYCGKCKHISMIKQVANICQHNQNRDVQFRLEYWISKIFAFANDRLGFVDAFHKIILLNHDVNEVSFDVRSIVYKSIRRAAYYNAEEISKIDFAANVKDITEKLHANQGIVVFILYQYYEAIISNTVIQDYLKFSLLKNYFNQLCVLADCIDDKNMRSQTVLVIFKYGVLQNENDQYRVKIYLALLNQLFVQNRYNKDDSFNSTISMLFRAIYYYSYLEKETIREEHRIKLQQLINLKVESMDNVLISLPRMIEENSHSIIKFLVNDACITESSSDNFDYFPEGFGAKSTIWTKEIKLRFAFWIYSIYGYDFSRFPTFNYLEDGPSLQNKKSICTAILEMYNHTDDMLNQEAQNNIKNLQMCLQTKDILPDAYFKGNFEYYNEQLTNLMEVERETISADVNLDHLNSRLYALMVEHPLIEYGGNLSIDNGKKYQVKPHYVHISANHEQISAREIQYAVRDIVNELIEKQLPEIQLEFNKEGVITLLTKLENETINFRNYGFVDDWGIDKDTRQTLEYKKLSEIISKIHFERTNEIRHKLFLAIENVKVNAEIVSYRQNELSDEQSDSYAESFKVAEGRYKIHGVVRNKNQAMGWVKQNIMIESAVIQVETNLMQSGFRVTFKY